PPSPKRYLNPSPPRRSHSTPCTAATWPPPAAASHPRRSAHRSLAYRKPRNLAVIAVARKLLTAVLYLLLVKPLHAEEETPFLRRKLRVQVKELKIAALRDLSFDTYRHFIDHISQKKDPKTATST